MGIGGEKREEKDFQKKVGLFEGVVVAINPTIEEYKSVLGIELEEGNKATEYLGESKDGNTYLRVAVWLKTKTGEKFPVTFFLEDKERENKDQDKKQYINSIGICAWAADPRDLNEEKMEWFSKREYRVAYAGEEDLYSFMRNWLSQLDYRSKSTEILIEWKKLMKGNVKDFRDQINGEWCTDSRTNQPIGVGAMATVITKEKDGETKEYQGVWNKAFLPSYALKNFNLIDYSDPTVVEGLKAKKLASTESSDIKTHERFVLKITGEHGCKDFFLLKALKDYNPEDNFVASDKPISEDGADY